MARKSIDYAEISREHKEIVGRIISPQATAADWDEFYATIRGIVAKRHAGLLWDKASLSVDDFMRGELTEFLRESQCKRLLQFLNLKSKHSDHQHLFGKWFAKVLLSAVHKAIPTKTRQKKNCSDIKRAKGSVSFAKLLKYMGCERFSRVLGGFWHTNTQETYIALMDAHLRFRHRKIVALVGYEGVKAKNDAEQRKKEASFIAGKIRNLRRKFFSRLEPRDIKAMIPSLADYPDEKVKVVYEKFIETQGEGFFSADGTPDSDILESMGAARETMFFRSVTDGEGTVERPNPQWILKLKMPFDVSDKVLIRGVLSDGKGGVPQGTLFCCGKKRKVRSNGHFEFPVREFKKSSHSSELYFISTDGKKSAGTPYVPFEVEEYCPTLGMLETWAERSISESDSLELTADLLDDFGYVLPQLLLKDEALASLPFKDFGVPRIDRKHIRREYNEAFVLFRSESAVDCDSPLSSDGVMLPLEWRYYPGGAGHPSNYLPLRLSALSRRVLTCVGESEASVMTWQLNPSARFFDDRVDFSSLGLLGNETDETDVASATGALAVAFKYAQNGVRYEGWPFISLKYDFTERKPQSVGGIEQKMSLVESFGGDRLFVSPDQQGISTHAKNVMVRKVSATALNEIAEEVAFDHLRMLRPTWPVQFKAVDEDILAPRWKLSEGLFKFANKKEYLDDTGAFVILFGGPGMGKSVLMWLLKRRCEVANNVIGYVCQAGRPNQGWEFMKSLAHGLASTYGETTGDLLSVTLPDVPPTGEALRKVYRNLVVDPLKRVMERRKSEKLFVLVDGLDEDASGEVAGLLLDPRLHLPPKVGVVASSRHIVQDEDRLVSRATDVMDLDEQGTECANDVRMDVSTYIDHWLHMNMVVNNWLMNENLKSEDVKNVILDKDRSFLYASYVFAGIAEGRYGVRKEWNKPISLAYFTENLPPDLKACFYDAFKACFPNEGAYLKVKPLLRLLARKGRVRVTEAKRKSIVGDENLGAILKALRGYAVESEGEISLSSEALRMWLRDSTHNAEFGV